MADWEKERAERVGDPQVSAAYRALAAEEPPRALDEAILAASRSPAKGWTQRWALPLSLAAVMVLSVVVTLRVQQEQPELVTAEAPRAAPEAAPQKEQPLTLKAADQLKSAAQPVPKLEARRAEPKPFADKGADRAPKAAALPGPAQAPAAPPPAAVSGNLASRGDSGGAGSHYGDSALRREEDRLSRDAEAAARAPQAAAALAKRSAPEAVAPKPAPAPAAAPARAVADAPAAESAGKTAADTPEQEFERIAQLRREGRNDEADKAFLEFRRRYPDFRITEEMLRRVERR